MMRIDFKNVLGNQIGTEHGLGQVELGHFSRQYQGIIREMAGARRAGKLPFLDLPDQPVREIEQFARRQSGRWSDVVVLGIGGSALGTRTLHAALNPPFYNLLPPKERKNHPRLFVLDNVDPAETAALFQQLNPRTTLFNVVSKSGATIETAAAFLYARDWLKKSLGAKYLEHFVITTDRQKGLLRAFAQSERVTAFDVPEGVEGRYTVLSPVSLLPAALTGINIKKILQGARTLDKELAATAPPDNPAYQAALVNYLLDTRKRKTMVVLMPYAAALRDFSEWFRQLWAESLGKRYSLSGREVFTGPTPINALGATDQHSQIQLYNEGPNNKVVIFIEVEKFRDEVRIPKIVHPQTRELVKLLGGKTLSDLMHAEKQGTERALTQNQRPNYTMTLPDISEATIGGLLYFWELATAYAGKMYNVNAFNQPGVETGKQITAAILNRAAPPKGKVK